MTAESGKKGSEKKPKHASQFDLISETFPVKGLVLTYIDGDKCPYAGGSSQTSDEGSDSTKYDQYS